MRDCIALHSTEVIYWAMGRDVVAIGVRIGEYVGWLAALVSGKV